MNRAYWAAVIGRIVPEGPLDIDAVVFGAGPAVDPVPGPRPPPGVRPPSMRLLHTREPGSASIGIRLKSVPRDVPGLAFHLAAMACEKGVDAIILSQCGLTGFETFGFRVERIPRDPAGQAQAEAELAALWGIAIIVDAEDIQLLG
jgi:hypothetical protein